MKLVWRYVPSLAKQICRYFIFVLLIQGALAQTALANSKSRETVAHKLGKQIRAAGDKCSLQLFHKIEKYLPMWANLYAAVWAGKLDASSAKTRADYDLTLLRIHQLKDVKVVTTE